MAFLVSNHVRDLLFPLYHPGYLKRHRAKTIITRVRLVSVVFSILTICWIPIDILAFEFTVAMTLVLQRLVVTAIFIALALSPDREYTIGGSLLSLTLMLAIPLSLYVTSQLLLGGAAVTGMAGFNLSLYAGLPYIVLAGLCLFPLVVIEAIAFAVPILVVMVGASMIYKGTGWLPVLSDLWILVLALFIYVMADMMQIYYMATLMRRASLDPLTGAFTRRSGNDALDLQFRIATEKAAPYAVAFLDIDDFKSLNDTYGHDEGDVALKNMVSKLAVMLRNVDAIVRWGGEEFVILLGETDLPGVATVIRRIVTDWLGTRPDGGPVTVSIGVAERKSDGIDDWPDLVDLADKRMYQAKKSGKARCFMPNNEEILPT